MRELAVAGVLSAALASCAQDYGSIMAIQGDGLRSPVEGLGATAVGIVTAVRTDGRGFWIQHPDRVAGSGTSSGLLIWTALTAAPGDRVLVQGTVAEFERERDLSTTQLQDIEVLEVQSTDNPLPVPVALTLLPDVSIPDAIELWEAREGMLVRFDRARVVGPTNAFGELVVVLEGQAAEGNHIFVRPLGDDVVDYNPERIIIDDETRDAIEARPGDLIESFVGVVDYSFGNYKLQPVDLRHVVGPRIPPPARTEGGVAIATFNVENLFDDDPDALAEKVDALAKFVGGALRVPELLVVQEVESEAVLQVLGDRINAVHKTRYRATARGSSDRRGIENAFLYDTARVVLRESYLLSGDDVDAAFGPESPSPGREPLVGTFVVSGTEVVVIGNHFKSKGGDDPLFGRLQPFERPTERQRKAQARAVRRFVDEILAVEPGALVLIAGDFNDFPFAEPGEGPDHPLGILAGEDFDNVVWGLPSPYTFIYDGNAQVLDHLLVSPGLRERVLGTEIVHGNADVPGGASDHDVPVVRLRLP